MKTPNSFKKIIIKKNHLNKLLINDHEKNTWLQQPTRLTNVRVVNLDLC